MTNYTKNSDVRNLRQTSLNQGELLVTVNLGYLRKH